VAVNLDTTGELSSEDGRETAQRFAVASDLRRALNELPNLQRETLILSYFGGMSQSEVASRIDAPLGTIKSRTSGGLQRLASLVGTSGLQ
jgi:RNA polymerase sigma-70 factor (ECF subfamily)